MSPPSTFGAGGAGAEGAEGSLAEEVRQANEEPKSNADYIREAETDALTGLANSEIRQRKAQGDEVSEEQRQKIIERIGKENKVSQESIEAAQKAVRPDDTLTERQKKQKADNEAQADRILAEAVEEEKRQSTVQAETTTSTVATTVDAAVSEQARQTDAAVSEQARQTDALIAEGTSEKAFKDATKTAEQAAATYKGTGTNTISQERITKEEASRRQKADREAELKEREELRKAGMGVDRDPFG